MLNTVQQLGSALGVALLNTLYASALSAYLSAHSAEAGAQVASVFAGYRTAFGVGGSLMLLALLSVLLLMLGQRQVSR